MIFHKKSIRIRVAALIIKEKKILLIAHKKQHKIYWLLPGGGIGNGETLSEGLFRELNEELNIGIKIHDIAFICESIDPAGGRHILNIVFHCSDSNPECLSLGKDERLFMYEYFDIDDLKNLKMLPPINDLLIKLLNGDKIADIYKGKMWLPL